MKPLIKLTEKLNRKGPLVLIILDGFGIGKIEKIDAIQQARTPNLDRITEQYMNTSLMAHGTAVGLPGDKDMGNSEVGHNAMGAGRIFDQGAKLVNDEIKTGKIFETELWKKIIDKPLNTGNTIHFIGLLSDGNVHSHIDHLFALIEKLSSSGVKKVRIHPLLDGRDVPETSAPIYIAKLEALLEKFNKDGKDYLIASGGGRMVTTMDRYQANWEIVKHGWDAHVLGKARPFRSATEAIETFLKEDPDIIDQYLPAFTIVNDNGPVGPILDGDSVILFNFRGDRAIEISRAFDDKDFDKFDRERYPEVTYAGMMEYDGDQKIPKNYLVFPPAIDKTVSEYLALANCRQYAISETQKFGHVTYFWNGNMSGKIDDALETYIEIPSDKVRFDERPWMKAAEITDSVIEAIESNKYDFLRLNLANGDMVGHTGDMNAAIIAAEIIDLCLGRLLETIEDSGSIAIITADHGNLDEMFSTDKSGKIKIDQETGKQIRKTSHTLNPVPLIVFDPGFKDEYRLSKISNPGLGNIAATLLYLMGYEPPDDYLPSLIESK